MRNEPSDLGALFGAGFPPFRGGPMRYADSLGLRQVETRIRALFAEKASDGGMLTFRVVEPSLFTEELAGR